MDIEKILSMYEDDYNPSSTVQGPRNMYAGGQLVSNTVDGSRPGYNGKPLYQTVEGQPHIRRHPVSKKYLVNRGVMRDGKTTHQYKGGIDDLDEAIKIRDTFVKDLPVETTAETNIRTKKGKGTLVDPKELQKAAKWFYKRGEISSPNYLDLKEAELKKVYTNVSRGATPGKFSKTTIFDPLKKSAQNKILKQFPDADFDLWKKGFNSKADPQAFAAVDEFIKRGYKPAFHNVENLPKKTQKLIVEAFGKEATDAGIELKFGPGRKFGVTPKENKQLSTMIQNFIQNTGKEYPYAFSFEKPENWVIQQMHRASKNNPAYKVLRNDAGKIIGASENGVEYYHANSKIGNTITNHTEAPKISKFVSVAKNAKANIPESLMRMFPEGFDTNLLREDRAYNDLLQWLDNSKGRRITANAINVHHAGAGGVGGNPALAKDLQLLTRQDNITAEVIKNEIVNNNFSRVQELKDKGIRLNVGGKEYGAGVETAEQGLKRIETQAGTQLRERLKTDSELNDFKNFLKKDLIKLCSRKGSASGGRIGFNTAGAVTGTVACGAKALDDGLTTGKWESPEKANIAKEVLKKAGKGGIGARLLSELFGPVALASIPLFEAGIAGYDTITSGTPFKEAVNKTLLSPLLGDKWKANPETLQKKDILKMSDGPEKEMLIKHWGNIENLNRVMGNYKKKYNLEQDKEQYEIVDMMGYGDKGASAAQAQKQIEDIKKKIAEDNAQGKNYNVLTAAADDPYAKGLVESKEGELLASRDANSWASRMFGTENPYYSSSNYRGKVDPDKIAAMKAKGPTYDQLNKWSPGANQDKGKYSRDEIIKFLGTVPDIEITDENVDFLQTKLNANYFRDVLKQPGMLGTQHSEGGIASLNVNKK